ncbi:uncharacterized protein LOC122278570 [Carya illinoinensis]|uniref:uncharacterized protein LOC122278570 n=1 Tax=Carya illinoinensis TaxID=32201 RepID=UPI001C719C2B|nr:uncharacterized protein LOC122278570 [Carya illinoinensis]
MLIGSAAVVEDATKLGSGRESERVIKVESGRFTGVYGQPEASKRHKTWNLLRSIKIPSDQGWFLMGDFNEVLSVNEKVGGRARTDRQIQEFCELLDDCGLLDLGYIGNPFTWCNKREPEHSISERLDQGLANPTWKNFYPMASVSNGSVAYSDHVPIKLQLHNDRAQSRGQKLFRFEAMWVEDKSCKPLIEKAWVNTTGDRTMVGVLKQIQKCGEHLAKWNKNKFGNVQKKLR